MAANRGFWDAIKGNFERRDQNWTQIAIEEAHNRGLSIQTVADTFKEFGGPEWENSTPEDAERFLANVDTGYNIDSSGKFQRNTSSQFDDSRTDGWSNVAQDPNADSASNSNFDPLHMSAVQSVSDQQNALQNSIMNNPNYVGAGGSTQTTSFGNVPDWESYVRNHPDLLNDFMNNQAIHGITDIKTYGQFHNQRYGSEGREVPTTDAGSAGYLQPTVETNLSDRDQAIFDANQRTQRTAANIGEQQLGQAEDSLSTPFSTEGLFDPSQFIGGDAYDYTVDPSVGGQEAIRDAMMARAQPRMDQEREQTENDLLVRGFNPGTEGYSNRMFDLSQKENDFYNATTLAAGQEQGRLFGMEGSRRGQDISENELAYGTGQNWRNQQLQESLLERQTPLNEYSALTTGSQVNMPISQQYNPFGIQGQNVEGAAQEGYNRNFAQSQQKRADRAGMTEGLFQLGGAYTGGAATNGWNPMGWG